MLLRLTFLCFFFTSLWSSAQETSVSKALETAKSDLLESLETLEKTRATIASEKPELAAEFQKIEQELAQKRRLARIARLSEQDRKQNLQQLETEASTLRQDAQYIASLLKEHALKTNTQAPPGLPKLNTSSSEISILDTSIIHLSAALGGSTAPGKAIDPSGNLLNGTFASFGPVTFFLADNKEIGGDVIPSTTGNYPKFLPSETAALTKLFNSQESTQKVDLTGGDARDLAEINGGPLQLLQKGGLWIWPIIFLALASLLCGCIKLFTFLKYREPNIPWLNKILSHLQHAERQEAQQLAAAKNHPASPVIQKLIEHSDKPQPVLEEVLYEQLMEVKLKAGTLLPVIAITAATAPLIGLLGTVSGMITTFNLITLFGSGDPKPLAGGISEALITTLFGLVVAIPALILHAYLSRRAQGFTQTTERLGLIFINGLANPSPPTRP